jgi:hypothetical protein
MAGKNENGIPFPKYSYPIYKQWDKDKVPCKRNPDGWVALLLKDYPNVSIKALETQTLAPRETEASVV